MRSAVCFPLRSNASSLLLGGGVNSVRRRIQLASLLYDDVLLEGGQYVAWAGPTGATALWFPPPPGSTPAWQPPQKRHASTGGKFTLGFRPTGAPEDQAFHPVVQSEATIAWSATLTPFLAELPRGAHTRWAWLHLGHLPDTSDVTSVASSWTSETTTDQTLQRLWPHEFVRNAILEQTHRDLALAGLHLNTPIAVDRTHQPVVAARIRAGAAEPVLGHRALHLMVPQDFGWQDVAELRQHRALRDYRSILAEVEAAALRTATSDSDLDEAIRKEYAGWVERALQRRPPRWAKFAWATMGFTAGLAMPSIGPATIGAIIPPAVGTLAGVVADSKAAGAMRPRWLEVHGRLRATKVAMG